MIRWLGSVSQMGFVGGSVEPPAPTAFAQSGQVPDAPYVVRIRERGSPRLHVGQSIICVCETEHVELSSERRGLLYLVRCKGHLQNKTAWVKSNQPTPSLRGRSYNRQYLASAHQSSPRLGRDLCMHRVRYLRVVRSLDSFLLRAPMVYGRSEESPSEAAVEPARAASRTASVRPRGAQAAGGGE